MTGTLLLPESGQTSKLFSKCCALGKVVRRSFRWRKHRRLADRVHRSTKHRTTSAACPTLRTMKVPRPDTGDSQSVRSGERVNEREKLPYAERPTLKIVMNNWLPKSVLCLS